MKYEEICVVQCPSTVAAVGRLTNSPFQSKTIFDPA